MKKSTLVIMALIVALITIGFVTHTEANADVLYKRTVVDGSEELMNYVASATQVHLEKVMNGEIDKFEIGIDKDGQLYIEDYVKGKLFTETTKYYTNYYIINE